MKSTFKVTDEENNPFFTVREINGTVETLVDCFVQSEQHWNSELLHSLARSDLESEDFASECLDLEKKGYIVLEDIVRFLNMETGTFYRNRDIYLIFRRISED